MALGVAGGTGDRLCGEVDREVVKGEPARHRGPQRMDRVLASYVLAAVSVMFDLVLLAFSLGALSAEQDSLPRPVTAALVILAMVSLGWQTFFAAGTRVRQVLDSRRRPRPRPRPGPGDVASRK